MRGQFIRIVIILTLLCSPAADAALVRSMHSPVRADEYDTADQKGGQAGGLMLGRNYALATLRCGAGEAIVGARIQRGSVLDHVQIACAAPSCDGANCRWSSFNPGPAAGNEGGGDAYPGVTCAQDEVVSGIRVKVVSFTVFDYAADLSLACAKMLWREASGGTIAVEKGAPRWVGGSDDGEPSGAKGLSRRAPGSVTISCGGAGARAFSLGIADFARQGQRVVQAISLYCPKATASPGADAMLQAMDQCLRQDGGPSYYESPLSNRFAGPGATYDRASATLSYDPADLDGQKPWRRAFWLAGAMGAHVANLERRRFGEIRTPRAFLGMGDYVAGYLVHCIRERGFLPAAQTWTSDHPLTQYEDFLANSGFRLPDDPPGVPRSAADWDMGFKDWGMGLHPSVRH